MIYHARSVCKESIRCQLFSGYMRQNILRRRVYNLNHDEICDEFLTENHAIMMYDPMLPQEG